PGPAKPTRIAVAPLSTLGAEDTSAAAKKLEGELARDLAAVSGANVVAGADVADEIKKAKKPILRACDGNASCLTELGKLMGASHVVFGEVGGLGNVQVVYLVLVDVQTGKEVRRTQVQLGAAAEGGIKGGAVRLVDPDRYTGRLVVTTPVKDAVIYVDGRRVGKSPAPPTALPVGPHALRVTHPEHRDFVRFVEVGFDQDTPVAVELTPYGAIETELGATDGGKPRSNVTYVEGKPRWYREWWAIAGFSAAALTGAIIIGVATADGVAFDASGTVKPPQ
ncbi:MAG: PEGA domain-containing protein, partial [Deltaproteobacteria bacterium]|nr:PEGA domain-containing protein [Kofleriaceae bacterium]